MHASNHELTSISTAGLAGAQPITEQDKHLPGEFPETPAASTPATEKTFAVNPIPASSGTGNPVALAAGEKVPEPSTLHNNTIESGVHDDPELKAKDAINTFGVTPIPATGGTGNPVHLQPGEEVPHHSTLTSNTIDSNVKLDKASYEKSDSGAPQLPPVLSPGSEQEANGAQSIFGLGPAIGNPVIPESSLPMGEKAVSDLGPSVSSVAPQSTTNELAGQQPILPRGVPEVVSESQNNAHTNPEAAANAEAVQDKTQLENELKQKVIPEPATAQSGSAPQVVEESQEKAHVDPEAASNAEAVNEKSQVEDELKEKVPEAPTTTESGILGNSERGVTGAIAGGAIAAGTTAAAGAAAGAYALRQKATEATGKDPVAEAPQSVKEALPEKVAGGATTSAHTDAAGLPINPAEVPHTVEESQEKAHVNPEASGNPEAVVEKADIEDELKEKVHEAPATSESGLLGKSESNNNGVIGAVAGGAAVAGAATAAGIYAVNNKVTETTGTDAVAKLPQSVQDSINNMNSKGTTGPTTETAEIPSAEKKAISQDPTLPQQPAIGEPVSVPAGNVEPEVAAGVPKEVADSQNEAHVAPEAAANPEAVNEKLAVEQELQKSIKPVEASGTPAPVTTAETTAFAPSTSASGAPQLGNAAAVSPISMENDKPSTGAAATAGGVGAATAAAVGATAITNQTNSEPTGTTAVTAKTDAEPADTAAVTDKSNAEPATGSKELNASAATPAKSVLQEERLAAPEQQTPLDSRDVSPMSRVATKNHPESSEAGPTVTDGVTSESAPTESKPEGETAAAASTPSKPVGSRPAASDGNKEKRQSFMDRVKGTPESTKTSGAASATDSSKKRRSFFGRIKDKLSSK